MERWQKDLGRYVDRGVMPEGKGKMTPPIVKSHLQEFSGRPAGVAEPAGVLYACLRALLHPHAYPYCPSFIGASRERVGVVRLLGVFAIIDPRRVIATDPPASLMPVEAIVDLDLANPSNLLAIVPSYISRISAP
jgi:hypothetical protein